MGLGSHSESQKPRIFKFIYPRVMGLLRPPLHQQSSIIERK